jgi:hypothetical protein
MASMIWIEDILIIFLEAIRSLSLPLLSLSLTHTHTHMHVRVHVRTFFSPLQDIILFSFIACFDNLLTSIIEMLQKKLGFINTSSSTPKNSTAAWF